MNQTNLYGDRQFVKFVDFSSVSKGLTNKETLEGMWDNWHDKQSRKFPNCEGQSNPAVRFDSIQELFLDIFIWLF